MAKLTAADKKRMPKSKFAVPETKDYPINDKNHAGLAKSGASHARRVGNISAAKEAMIDRKADKVLGKSKSKSKGKK